MQPSRRDAALLWDMLSCARDVEEAVRGVSREAYLQDRVRQLAVERAIGVLGEAARQGRRSFRGFNPALAEDIELLAALLRGEHAIHGIRKETVRQHLFGETRNPVLRRRQANRTSRLLKRLHVHGLIAKIPRTRRWRLTAPGTLVITAILKCHYEKYPQLLAALAS